MVLALRRVVGRQWPTSTRSTNFLFPSSSSFCSDGMESSRVKIFDRDLKRKQRDRAAWLMRGNKDSFADSVAENLLDRLEDCKRTFPTALCLGGSLEAMRRSLRRRGGIEKFIMMDMSVDMVKHLKDTDIKDPNINLDTTFVVGDEEFLPVKESSLDLVISCLGLHWTNDLPGAMIQCRLALKPDGLFLAAILGGETLKELRIACTIAHMEREGGISPRISPLAQVRDAGNLLTRAGFSLPGVDVDEYTVRYESGILQYACSSVTKSVIHRWGEAAYFLTIPRPYILMALRLPQVMVDTLESAPRRNQLTEGLQSSSLELIEHLRAMGETNALFQRSHILKRETALATAAIYDSMFAAEDGTVPATFQVIYMTGWKEHSSQQKPKSRGSATVSFKDIQKQFGSGS